MAKVSNILKFKHDQKYTSRNKNRCNLCGRARGYLGKFGLCRLCFRELAHKGELPGVIRATW
ncbi:30S ribosomal protein S14 type Z [Candidatus Gottesmanbacteria bacterium RIFCSPHIGHO2_01_FULL_42_12]|uniref:Small ribosomal subunit protein uS14 n=1 Tax=Candidatus Gottesmanbacteria bacterium RIFCSPHIGHO2_01_FULL_42_12 TaxID=1798377 RepID=A0A1F5Z5A4_9BACT|nr:MAG: 30S ribosomal protein S14 type Z [Candidatus Gottesmanbacteria bacterium RIFCSPHIGHO2_01_FULL_42_12]